MRRRVLPLAALALVAAVAGCGKSSEQALRPCKLQLGGVARNGSGFAFGSGLAATLPDGSLVLGASSGRGSKLRVVLRRVSQNCQIARSFGKNGTTRVTLNAAGDGAVDSIVATRGGQLLLAGSDGRHELVGRLLANGRLDRSFGAGGWTRVELHEHPEIRNPPPSPTATSIAIGPSGSIFLGGDDEEAHCCVQNFVTELSADGKPVSGFGHGGSIILRRFTGSYGTDVVDAGKGDVYAVGETIFSGCGGPVIARIRPDGSLDSGFDLAVAASIKEVETRRHLLFAPALVPGQPPGRFALVGALERECGPVAHPTSGGAAVGILRSGQIDRAYGHKGETLFASPASSFELASALRLPSGAVLVAAPTYGSSSDALKTLRVQALSGSGSLEWGRSISLAKFPRTDNTSFNLVPAGDGGAWVVLGFPKEIDLIPIAASAGGS
jgi:hypothetical protein